MGHDERQLAANAFAGISSSSSEIYVDEPEAKEAQVLQPSQPPPTAHQVQEKWLEWATSAAAAEDKTVSACYV